MLIDSHAHLDMRHFERDRQRILERALKGGITHIITVGTDLSSSMKGLDLAHRYDYVFSSVGYHPHNASGMDQQNLKKLTELASEPKIVAWGEIGLDFFRRLSPPQQQIEAFERQLDMAARFSLPVIIHDREAHSELLAVLRKKEKGDRKGVIHCYSGDYDLAMTFIEMGYFISIPGIVTYQKAYQLRDVAARIPVDYMLLETDAPFLAPVPERGKRNEPFFITYTAQEIARLRGVDFQELARRTSENAKRLFNLPDLKPT